MTGFPRLPSVPGEPQAGATARAGAAAVKTRFAPFRGAAVLTSWCAPVAATAASAAAVTPAAPWAPPRPAIIRPAEHTLLRPGAFRPCTRAERRTILADLVRSGRMTGEEARRALIFIPWVGGGSGHRYWRLRITGFQSAAWIIIGEVQFRIGGVSQMPVMTGYTTAGVTVTDSGSYPPASLYGWNAFDGAVGTQTAHNWAKQTPANPEWLKVDFGARALAGLTSVAIAPRSTDGAAYICTAFAVDYSDDDSGWTTVLSRSGLTTGWANGTFREFSV